LRFVEAMSWSSCSLIDPTIDFDAPFSSLLFFSPRLAARAAPAAICWALDFAAMTASLLHVLAAGSRDTAERSCTTPGSIGIAGLRDVAEWEDPDQPLAAIKDGQPPHLQDAHLGWDGIEGFVFEAKENPSAHDIAHRRIRAFAFRNDAKSVEEARNYYAKEFADYRRKKPTPYMEGLRFSPRDRSAADPDVRILPDQELKAAAKEGRARG
jgi:hypothetical protein